jgi:biopolymer transport protein ExbB
MFDVVGIVINGGPIMVPLLACSIIALAVVIERFLFRRRISTREIAEEMLSLAEGHDFAPATELGRADFGWQR